MPYPRFCRNPACEYCHRHVSGWCVRNGTYSTIAHGTVQRFRCRCCGRGASMQTESMHYFAKRRLDLRQILSRVRGGSSLRDIGREIGCSRTAVANAVLRLGRQAMAAHVTLMSGIDFSGRMSFDGLVSAVGSRDYPSQITTLCDCEHELILAMTHCVTERGGTRTQAQQARIERRRAVWRPRRGALTGSIRLLVNELPRFAPPGQIHLDTDEHPLYPMVLAQNRVTRRLRDIGMLEHERTPGSAPRTTRNPLFLMNYVDRMIRHRVKEHTRESIAIGQNATMQMHRMWIFAWDHNVRQPLRVQGPEFRPRAECAGAPPLTLARLQREFYSRRHSLRMLPMPESIRKVWMAELDTPPVRWKKPQKSVGPQIRGYARRDLSYAYHHGG